MKKSKGNPNFTLKSYPNFEANHFIKQDSLAIKPTDTDISLIRVILRLLTVVMIVFLIFSLGKLNSSLEDSKAYSERYFTFMTTYRIPMILGNNYYKHILQIGDQNNVQSQIHLLST